ncbi:response regulator [Paenibacillus psychroresistens]|uniref:Response regulator n=1 Tax=Paenibacillus psychroresistens TaxID=1778678 RepID=A0A6B8RRF8_9BACL|nr:response regulator [Paenibacillus psychroresistens]QGQ97976.1 response regulator [Paenibacillus psychroresistens]
MTYKVFVVDDEPMIRYGLTSCISWAQEGLELIGEAANGEAALQLIQQQEVDILITDIKMPVMDGLELTRRVKSLYPDIKVILVSSYSDFEYAREAVQLGVVVDYLLKPTMEPADLLRILQVCKMKLDESAVRVQKSMTTKNNDLENGIKKLLQGEVVQFSVVPVWLKEPLVVSVWKLEAVETSAQAGGLEKLIQLEKAKSYLLSGFTESIGFITSEQQLVLVTGYNNGSINQQLEKAQQYMQKQEKAAFTVGISESIHSIEAITAAYKWASHALDQAFFDGRNKCYLGKISSHYIIPKSEDADLVWLEIKERFSKAYAAAIFDESENALRALYAAWDSKLFSANEVILQAKSLITIIWSRNMNLKTNDKINGILDKLQEIILIDTLQKLISYMNKEFKEIWESNKISILNEDSNSAHAIQLAMSYIQENYRSELTLQSAADHVHMSRNYFSEQFKKVSNLNFIDFVIQLRINNAMQMLRQTNLKVYDIGSQSGFNSSKHFLKLFKREVKCTPAEYRQSQRELKVEAEI